MPAIIGVRNAKIIERVRVRVARIVPASVEARQNNFKNFSKKLLTSKIRAARIHFMVKQQTT